MKALLLALAFSLTAHAADAPHQLKWQTQIDHSPPVIMSIDRSNKAPTFLFVYDDKGNRLVEVNTVTGAVKLHGVGAAQEGAQQFWRAVGRQFAECGK